MKKKTKPPLPRRRWTINPVTRVKESARVYSRQQTRRTEKQTQHEE
jgi:hypothetical protein